LTGKRKIAQLKDNANYFRQKLVEMGLHVIGQNDSPIIPVMLLQPTKIAAFSRECFERGLAVVVPSHAFFQLEFPLLLYHFFL
jgi:serine palmitoyltransferase